MNQPTIKTVAVTKRGRFWAVHTDGQLLALVLYKKGALAVRDLLVCLADITINEPPKAKRPRAARPVKASSSQSPATAGQNAPARLMG